MTARYITKAEIERYERDGWNVVQFAGHHGRYYLAWRVDE